MQILNILIAEDEASISSILEYLIKEFFKNKYSNKKIKILIDIAQNGIEALGYISIKKYDLIFLMSG